MTMFAAAIHARSGPSCLLYSAVAFAAIVISIAPAASGQVVSRVSVSSTGVEGNAESYAPAISADGRFVAFVSESTNLAPGNLARDPQVFVHDRTTGTTECASVSSSGLAGDRGAWVGGVSSDGRFVTFTSYSTNLVEGVATGFNEVFLRDRVAGTTEWVSLPSSELLQDGNSFAGGTSADGRFVVFMSYSSKIVEGDTNHSPDVFVRDRLLGQTERVSVDPLGGELLGNSFGGSISADGRLVAFDSDADSVIPVQLGNRRQFDVYVHDRSTGANERVSVDSNGKPGNSQSWVGMISSDGTCVAFVSYASNLVANDTNNASDVFVRDRIRGITERVSVDAAGGELKGTSELPAISADGSVVAFATYAGNVVPTDTNGHQDVFLRDRKAGATRLASENCAWLSGNDDSYGYDVALSDDGTVVAFSSYATDLVDRDRNRVQDLFVNDFAAPPDAASWNNYGSGFPGTLGIPTLTASADPVFGTSFSIDASNSSGSWSDGLLLIGLKSASIPTSAGGTLLVDPELQLLFVLLPAGRSLVVGVPYDPQLCGMSFFLQALELDPGAAAGISFTPGLKLTIGH
jgi:Tol biopolymer transport system component